MCVYHGTRMHLSCSSAHKTQNTPATTCMHSPPPVTYASAYYNTRNIYIYLIYRVRRQVGSKRNLLPARDCHTVAPLGAICRRHPHGLHHHCTSRRFIGIIVMHSRMQQRLQRLLAAAPVVIYYYYYCSFCRFWRPRALVTTDRPIKRGPHRVHINYIIRVYNNNNTLVFRVYRHYCIASCVHILHSEMHYNNITRTIHVCTRIRKYALSLYIRITYTVHISALLHAQVAMHIIIWSHITAVFVTLHCRLMATVITYWLLLLRLRKIVAKYRIDFKFGLP